MVMFWLAAFALAQEDPTLTDPVPEPPAEGLSAEELEQLESLLEALIESGAAGIEADLSLELSGASALQDLLPPEPEAIEPLPEPDDGFHEPLIAEDEWLLHELPEDWHEPQLDDVLTRRVPLWFGLEAGTLIGARVELSREEWPVEGALRLGSYTRVGEGSALQPTAIAAVEYGRGLQIVAGGGVTLRDGEWTPIGNVALQRDRRHTPAHLQSGLLFDGRGWTGLDITVCWLW